MLENTPDKALWTIQQTLTGILFTLVPWLALALGLASLNVRGVRTTPLAPSVDLANAFVVFVFSSLIEGAFLIAPLVIVLRILRGVPNRLKQAWYALGLRRFRVGEAISWIIVLFLGIYAINLAYQSLIVAFHLPIQTNDQAILNGAKTAPLTTYATLIASVVVAPFCEEVFFRGFVFMGLLRAMSPVWAILLSAFIFALAHADPGSFAVLFIIGIALAFLRWRTRSLWPGILLHFLNNGVGAILIVLVMSGVVRQ